MAIGHPLYSIPQNLGRLLRLRELLFYMLVVVSSGVRGEVLSSRSASGVLYLLKRPSARVLSTYVQSRLVGLLLVARVIGSFATGRRISLLSAGGVLRSR